MSAALDEDLAIDCAESSGPALVSTTGPALADMIGFVVPSAPFPPARALDAGPAAIAGLAAP
jgi:hypothetical protein